MSWFLSAEEMEHLEGKAIGLTLVTPTGYPLGFGGAYFENNAHGHPVAVLFFYGGPNQIFVKKYRKLALYGMKQVFTKLVEMGCTRAYAVADKRIDKAFDLIHWLRGAQVDSQEEGDVFVIPLTRTPLTRNSNPWP